MFSILRAKPYTYDHTLKPDVLRGMQRLTYVHFFSRGLTGLENATSSDEKPGAGERGGEGEGAAPDDAGGDDESERAQLHRHLQNRLRG